MAKTIVAITLGMLMLGSAGLAHEGEGGGHACGRKAATAGCRNEITTCISVTCDGLSRREARRCKKACKREIKEACELDETVCTASPSGAFLPTR